METVYTTWPQSQAPPALCTFFKIKLEVLADSGNLVLFLGNATGRQLPVRTADKPARVGDQSLPKFLYRYRTLLQIKLDLAVSPWYTKVHPTCTHYVIVNALFRQMLQIKLEV